jgi:D,D-heptose 1,7-bisphosphate phosphatase
VATNQSGIARGLFEPSAYTALTDHLHTLLALQGVRLAGVYHCPHLPDAPLPQWREDCDCRKPRPGLVLRAARELGLDLGASVLVGDQARDIAAGRAAGVGRRVLVHAGAAQARACGADAAYPDLLAAARALVAAFTYLEDAEATIAGLRFYGSPWQPAFNDWAFNLPRGAPLAAVWSRIPTGLDVLVTHGPPAGIGDEGPVGGRAGCADLFDRVREVTPRLHMFGHIHQDGGLWHEGTTTFANVTTWECERGATVIDIESDSITPVIVPPPR